MTTGVERAEWTITPHAAARYQERVGPHPPRYARVLPLPRAAAELLVSVQRPLFVVPLAGGGVLLGCLNPAGVLFLAKADPASRVVQSCGPAYFWHEARNHWKRVGINPNHLTEVQRLLRRVHSG